MTNEENDPDAMAAAALYEEDLRQLQDEHPPPLPPVSHFGGVAGAEPGAGAACWTCVAGNLLLWDRLYASYGVDM